jgi:hypothetical protein
MAAIHIRDSEREGNGSSIGSEIVEITGALIVATLVLAVFMLLAAIDPATWTFQSNTASHLRSELWNCLATERDAARLSCYDDIARKPGPHPAKGANIPIRLLAK